MLAIKHSGGGQHGSRDDLAAIGERQALVPGIDRDSGHFERREELRAQPLRLRQGAACQFAAADAGRKAEIVLDPGTGARLPARRVPVEQQRPQPFRCAVHRGREAGRSGADDHEVVDIEGGRERPAEPLGDLTRLRVAQHRTPSSKNSAGSSSVAHARRIEQRARVRVPRDVEPVIRNEIAGQEVLDRVRSGRPLVSDEPQSFRLGQILGLPGVEEIVDDGEEAFLRRIPGLRQIVIEMRVVDGPARLPRYPNRR